MTTPRSATATQPIPNHISGEWVRSSGAASLPVEDPATREVLHHVPLSNAADVDTAVRAAKKAFPGWRETPPVCCSV
jgi:acyl-CoA reductase-like NAD-dependent aldehyde dehydrogenase